MSSLFGQQTLSGVFCLIAVFIATGCQLPPFAIAAPLQERHAGKTQASQRLIIKLKPGGTCDEAGIARLSLATRVNLEYIQPMSGDACVIRQFADDAGDFSQGQKALKQHPEVEWLEQDKKMKAF